MNTLLDDASARAALREEVARAGGDPDWVPEERPAEVMLVMCRRTELTPEALFSFSQLRLVTLANDFHRMGVPLTVRWVPKGL